MNQAEIGKFIARCRREKKLTQAQIAEKLNITDRAVSKWESGKSMPDSSIMLELCEILGITANELLSGEKIDVENLEKKADENLIELKRKDENNMKKNVLICILFSSMILIGIIVCLICDIAISGRLTWSPIPVSSMIFAWLILFPGLLAGKKGIKVSLISLSVFIIPYLYLLGALIKVKEVFSIGTAMAVPSIIFLWVIFMVFRHIGKTRKFDALGITFLLSVPFMFILNVVLSNMIAEPVCDVWDIMSGFIFLISAGISFACGRVKRKDRDLPRS